MVEERRLHSNWRPRHGFEPAACRLQGGCSNLLSYVGKKDHAHSDLHYRDQEASRPRPLKPFFGSHLAMRALLVFMPDAREAGGGDWTRTNILLAQNQAPDLSATPH